MSDFLHKRIPSIQKITKKIIFLDIDGVLNLILQDFDKYGSIFHKHFEDNLRYLIDQTGADIVISSTWRMGISRLYFKSY